MMRLRIAAPAAFEIADAARSYDATRPGLGSAFVQHIDAALNNIAQFPEMAAMAAPGFRRAVLHRFPYSVVYRVTPDGIDVLALFPTQANPETLLNRLLPLST